MTKIKICGLKSTKDISYVNQLNPDYIGFVFLQGRQRSVSFKDAAALRSLLKPEIQSVGVFVNEPLENVLSLLETGTIQLVQLHGRENTSYALKLKSLCRKPIIKAFIIKGKEDIKRALDYPCDYLLLDNGLGTGEAFDWSLIQGIHKPFFLAGGLNPANVKDAIKRTHPYAVDVSSGVETNCRKDYQKIKAFIEACHAADHIRS
ncbi:phosphoribosylanthranilate isomerase [Parablautia intestinalis]|jgi:phosphoribosylanthranilate isomerase|uniref:phosphoribosylanthranilate isomerase n=1 Tax=Parablautia intestinalis TaxID=2320100 RepID=UPI0023BBCF03|nr:phosphoribosylanthranilate isomerase [Parablautia intestinalis]MCI8615231.1 phosphoribosylanthranilate isomerase [Lachnospiraceae bacterium]MDE7047549.1 phosphoribosylanthranilate isomerase [Lachnospiraceae bacterium]